MVRDLAAGERAYLTLDDDTVLEGAREDRLFAAPMSCVLNVDPVKWCAKLLDSRRRIEPCANWFGIG